MSTLQIILTVLFFFVLVLCIAFFAASETAYLSISNFTLKRMLKNNEGGAKKIAALYNRMDRLLTIVLIGINFFSTLSASIGAAAAISILGARGITVSTVIVTFIITVGGEIIPKTVAASHPLPIAKTAAPALLVLQKIFFPLIWTFTKISQAASSATEKFWKHEDPLITEEELKTLIDVGAKEGVLESSEQHMFYKLFEFNDLHIYDIMRHRSLIKAVPVNIKSTRLIEIFTNTGLSRLPVYKGSIENITGFFHYKKLLFAGKKEISKSDFVEKNQSPALFVPESLTAIELLTLFKKNNDDIAVALDEQGCVAGLVTMDDLLRSVFDRITDEFSISEIPPEKRIKILSANEFLVPGDMHIKDVNSVLKLNLKSENFITLGGWLLERFDALPSTGESIKKDGMLFVVEDQASRRIQTVRIKLNCR
ncbi:HlyC/CorC family transporter [Treponema parvum]|uniref:HlyC/CorC family transporter n=1 Tax=Treponema parvum TaxID=138851 RepID=A0A975ID82_9SPIR|nr:hemolysin family protein [Treponema parvum]QTQ12766.1 HlyC/CorC family transporter [Treponema parvum]